MPPHNFKLVKQSCGHCMHHHKLRKGKEGVEAVTLMLVYEHMKNIKQFIQDTNRKEMTKLDWAKVHTLWALSWLWLTWLSSPRVKIMKKKRSDHRDVPMRESNADSVVNTIVDTPLPSWILSSVSTAVELNITYPQKREETLSSRQTKMESLWKELSLLFYMKKVFKFTNIWNQLYLGNTTVWYYSSLKFRSATKTKKIQGPSILIIYVVFHIQR